MFALQSLFNNFHFLRPFWLLAIIPIILITVQLWRLHRQKGQWQQLIPEHLLNYLLSGQARPVSRVPAALFCLTGCLIAVALSGPAWRQISTPVEKSIDPLVIVVDLSRSMLAADMPPNRLSRAKQKIRDILRLRTEGQTGLVAYAGSSHVVVPLTDDSETVMNLVHALHPDIMPQQGSQPQRAVEQAIKLLQQGAGQFGGILIMTDGIVQEQAALIHAALKQTRYTLSILGLGTEEGAPIPTASSGFVQDGDSGIVLARLEQPALDRVARENRGIYRTATLNDDDLQALLSVSPATTQTVKVERKWDQWSDEGYWLLFLIVPLASLAFRRGWLLPVLFCTLIHSPGRSYALEWHSLWQTPDQRGQELLQNNQPTEAAQSFTSSNWRAEALFQAKQYKEAAELFAAQQSAEGDYNQGNALAHAGTFDDALAAYDRALQKRPGFEQAQHNRAIVEELKKQQQQQQKDQKNGDSTEPPDDSKGDSGEGKEGEGDGSQAQDGDRKSDQQGPKKGGENGGQQEPENSRQKNQPDRNPSPPEQSDKQDDKQSDRTAEQEPQPPEPPDQQRQPGSGSGSDAESETEQRAAQSGSDDHKNSQHKGPSAPESAQHSPDSLPEPIPEEGNVDRETEAWLRRVPDNPGGLLRRKFEQQHRGSVPQGGPSW